LPQQRVKRNFPNSHTEQSKNKEEVERVCTQQMRKTIKVGQLFILTTALVALLLNGIPALSVMKLTSEPLPPPTIKLHKISLLSSKIRVAT